LGGLVKSRVVASFPGAPTNVVDLSRFLGSGLDWGLGSLTGKWDPGKTRAQVFVRVSKGGPVRRLGVVGGGGFPKFYGSLKARFDYLGWTRTDGEKGPRSQVERRWGRWPSLETGKINDNFPE